MKKSIPLVNLVIAFLTRRKLSVGRSARRVDGCSLLGVGLLHVSISSSLHQVYGWAFLHPYTLASC